MLTRSLNGRNKEPNKLASLRLQRYIARCSPGCNRKRGTLMSVFLRGKCKRAHRHSGECKHYHFTFNVRGRRHRGAIPEARTKWQAEQAEQRIRQEVFEGRFGRRETGTGRVCDFIDRVYLPWAKANKRSWRDDEYKLPALKAFLKGAHLRDVTSIMVEQFKQSRLATPTKHDTQGS
jgi:hypothetical protein